MLGQQLVLSINRYQQLHGQPPTWADAVAGIDPALLAPIPRSPTIGHTSPALWRRELRQHLMSELRRTRWITYTHTPRSLQPGDQGRGWLRTTIHHGAPHDMVSDHVADAPPALCCPVGFGITPASTTGTVPGTPCVAVVGSPTTARPTAPKLCCTFSQPAL